MTNIQSQQLDEVAQSQELKILLHDMAERILTLRQRQELNREQQIARYLESVKHLQDTTKAKLIEALDWEGEKQGKLEVLEFQVEEKRGGAGLIGNENKYDEAGVTKRSNREIGDKEVVLILNTQKEGLRGKIENSLKSIFARFSGKRIARQDFPGGPGLNSRQAMPFDFGRVKESDQTTRGRITVKISKKTGNVIFDAINELNEWFVELSRIRTRDLVTFYQLLSVMVNSGIPLLKALQQLVPQTKNMRLRKVLVRLVYEIENGASLSDAMDLYPNIFDDSQRGMIRAGEASGSLTAILRRLADSLEKTDKIISKIRGAMTYPAFVVAVLIIVGVILMIEVIPKLSELFSGAGVKMPASTRFLMAVSDVLRGYYYLVILGVVIIVAAVMSILRTRWGCFYWHWLKLKLPVIGKITKMVCISKFSRGLGTLSSAGIPIVRNLRINADAIGNELYRRELAYTAEAVKRGITIADDLRQSKLFPPMVVNMIAVGEETAKLDEVSLKIADYYDQEIDTIVKGMSSIMEPAIIVVIGVMVALVVTAVMEPILKLSEVADVM